MADKFLIASVRNQLRIRQPIIKRIPKPRRILAPDTQEREYKRALRGIIDVVEKAVRSILLPVLPRLIEEARRLRKGDRVDAWSDELGNLSSNIRNKVDLEADDERRIASQAAEGISKFNLAQWQAALKSSISIDIFPSEPWLGPQLRSWARENAELIKSLEDDAVRRVATWTQKGLREGQRYEDISTKIFENLDVSRSKADFLARDQTAKLNSDLTQSRQEQIGVEEYTFSTSHDERVRGLPSGKYPKASPRHDVMDGKTCRWDDPTVYKNARGQWVPRSNIDGVELHPGKDYNCRCGAIAKLDHLLEINQ